MLKKHKRILIILTVVVVVSAVLIFGAVSVARYFLSFGFTSGVDQQFGDQHLKTSVALIELYKIRYGKYPASLDELKFVGDWDVIALTRVRYIANPQRTAYYVEVERGWMGKPNLEMPDEFWQGTGYRKELRPSDW